MTTVVPDRLGAVGKEVGDPNNGIWQPGFHYDPFSPELQTYIVRIDALRLDGEALARIGAELCADPRLSRRQREMLIARAAGANAPRGAMDQTRCRDEAEQGERCAFCFKGPGPGLTASGGRWFDADALLWRDRHGRVTVPVPREEQWHTRSDLAERAIGGQRYHLCGGCAVRLDLEQGDAAACGARCRADSHAGGQLTLDLD